MGKDKMTHKVGFRDHLWYKWNWSPGRGRDLPKVTYWESQWKSLRTLLIVAFHPTSKLETLPNLELGPLFFWTCDSIPKILPLFPFFLTIKARLLGMNYRVCSGLVIYIFCQAPSSPPGLLHTVCSLPWDDFLSLFCYLTPTWTHSSSASSSWKLSVSSWLGHVS